MEENDMTEQEINAAIDEALGPKLFVLHKPIHDPFGYYRENAHGYTNNILEAWKVPWEVAQKYITYSDSYQDKVVAEPAPTPNYTRDLNAIRAIRKTLTADQWSSFCFNLEKMARQRADAAFPRWREISPSYLIDALLIDAPADIQAEAFLRSIGKYRE